MERFTKTVPHLPANMTCGSVDGMEWVAKASSDQEIQSS